MREGVFGSGGMQVLRRWAEPFPKKGGDLGTRQEKGAQINHPFGPEKGTRIKALAAGFNRKKNNEVSYQREE